MELLEVPLIEKVKSLGELKNWSHYDLIKENEHLNTKVRKLESKIEKMKEELESKNGIKN